MQHHINNQQDCPDGNGRIRNVECRKIKTIVVKNQEVHDISLDSSIDQVADSTAKNQAKRPTKQRLLLVNPEEPGRDKETDTC